MTLVSRRNVYRLDDSEMEQIGLRGLIPGDVWELPDGAGSVEFVGYDRWISVKVARDPGGVWALAFVGTAILGLSLSLFIRRRRVWVLRDATAVTVGGVARGERTELTDELNGIVRELNGEPAGDDPVPQEGVST